MHGQNLPPYFRDQREPQRELTDLSSIDLATEEDEALPGSSRYAFRSEEPGEQPWGSWVAKMAAAVVAASVGCAVAAMLIFTARPLGLASPAWSLPGLPSLPLAGGHHVSARQLLESHELTALTTQQLRAADPQYVAVAGEPAVRQHVADGFRGVTAMAPGQLGSLRMTLEQRDSVLHVCRHLGSNPRMESTGRYVARALQEGARASRDRQGAARYVLEKLRPRFAEMRQLREEVIPQPLRLTSRSGGEMTLDQKHLRVVQRLRDRWNLEVDASMPEVLPGTVHAPMRRLQDGGFMSLGIGQHTGPFVEKMRTHAREAKGAMHTCSADLKSALHGLSVSSKDMADLEQIAKSTACGAILEAINAMDTVSSCLSSMMGHLAYARRNMSDSNHHSALTKKIFKQLRTDVTTVQQHLATSKVHFQETLDRVRPQVYKTDNASVVLTRSALVQVQGEVARMQAEMMAAMHEFKTLYKVYRGKGNLVDTVKLYSSSIFYQLQERFRVSLPDVGNASAVLKECLSQPSGVIHTLECRLTYAKVCMELLLGMDVEAFVETTTPPASPPTRYVQRQQQQQPQQQQQQRRQRQQLVPLPATATTTHPAGWSQMLSWTGIRH